jgi:molybdopterin biosynthesis enzyme
VEGGTVVARPLKWKGSADLFTLARAKGLVIREAGAGAVRAGEGVGVLLL